MSYLHIDNLYRPEAQQILLHKECYVLEKVDGTSAHISWKNGNLTFSSGGASAVLFNALFDHKAMAVALSKMNCGDVVIYGEAYGGKVQGLSHRYGKDLKFIAFDVRHKDIWFDVPVAEAFVTELGLEFVPYERVSTDLESLNAARDKNSEVSIRRGMGTHPREGIVIRPINECVDKDGDRIIAKHKGEDNRETNKPRPVVDPSKLMVLTAANEIADEWVVPKRLEHVLQKFPDITIKDTGAVIKAMLEDVLRESSGEIVDSPESRQAICKRARELFHAWIKTEGLKSSQV